MVIRKKHQISSNKRPSNTKMEKLSFLFRQQLIIIAKIWWQIVLVTVYAALVILLNHFYIDIFYMGFSASLVPILGVVTGLLLVFRTNTAYDRYYEGRRLWSQMTQVIRILIRSVWIIVPEESGQDVVEKKTVTNFLVAYAIASKHYLREEYTYDHPDLKKLIQHFPQMFSEMKQSLPRRMSVLNYAPPSNIPLQIIYYIGIFIQTMKKRYTWDPAISGLFYTSLNSLVECLSGFERIKRTPIPMAYSVHLYHVIWLYILSLPFQLVESMGWWTVAGVSITAFTFLGILEIGSQIEDPFGYDDNDLPLDDLCDVLATEINEILGQSLPTFDELFLATNYFPIAKCEFSASELASMSKDEVRTILTPSPDITSHLSPHVLSSIKIGKNNNAFETAEC